jgi:hypothetical protein
MSHKRPGLLKKVLRGRAGYVLRDDRDHLKRYSGQPVIAIQ